MGLAGAAQHERAVTPVNSASLPAQNLEVAFIKGQGRVFDRDAPAATAGFIAAAVRAHVTGPRQRVRRNEDAAAGTAACAKTGTGQATGADHAVHHQCFGVQRYPAAAIAADAATAARGTAGTQRGGPERNAINGIGSAAVLAAEAAVGAAGIRRGAFHIAQRPAGGGDAFTRPAEVAATAGIDLPRGGDFDGLRGQVEPGFELRRGVVMRQHAVLVHAHRAIHHQPVAQHQEPAAAEVHVVEGIDPGIRIAGRSHGRQRGLAGDVHGDGVFGVRDDEEIGVLLDIGIDAQSRQPVRHHGDQPVRGERVVRQRRDSAETDMRQRRPGARRAVGQVVVDVEVACGLVGPAQQHGAGTAPH